MAQRDQRGPDAAKNPLKKFTSSGEAKAPRVEETHRPTVPSNVKKKMASPFRCGLAESQAPDEVGSEKKREFQAVLGDLGLTELYPQRISLNSVLKITKTALSDNTPQSLKEIHKHFLYNVIRANVEARKTKFDSVEDKVKAESYLKKTKGFLLGRKNKRVVESISILDLITAVFLCSDSHLQQTLMVKMSLCHFALPLLLPDVSQGRITFLLWAMRPVVHTWRPDSKGASEGYMEQSMVTTPMPMISFMRIGECRISKSEVINSVISNEKHDFFVHRNMECGNFPRRLCNGLVEVCFHLPCGTPSVDVFSDIFAALNLRGDVRESPVQFQFLKATSDAVFVFVDKIGEKECDFLTSSFDPKSKLFLVMNPDEQHLEETDHFLNIVASKFNLNEENILHSEGQSNDVFFTDIKSSMNKVLNTGSRTFKTLETLSDIACNKGIIIDENNDDCQKCQQLADCIISDIKTRDLESLKATVLPAQGELWQKWSTKDKEQSRLKHRGDRDIQEYIDHLAKEKRDIRNQQSNIVLSDIVHSFVSACLELPVENKITFLQWMKMKLDAWSSEILFPLQETHKQLCNDLKLNKDELIKLNTKMTNSSLGLEHLMREAGQIYEASKVIARPVKDPPCMKLPSVMAQLLLNGFPMELLDGNAGCIPIDWVTDVLTQVRTQLGRDPRVFVLTVLGVQSSGKSTLLNVMFGLQFAVGSGRCTRGAFMQLLRIDDELKRQLGFDFLLVIDTEGLKALELASLNDSYEHDNELATVVIGLSDVVIVNLVSENAEEMKDILQVVVHALLRMTEAGKKPNCLLIHQKCGDVTAVGKNRNAHRLLLDRLDEMTKAAAKMEHKAMYYTKFTDIIAHDMNKDSYFIPALRSGSSEMATVSRGYSEQVFKLKTHIFEILKIRQSAKPCTLSNFSEWMSMIWHSVKRETYIFSFKNILVIEAYNRLCSKYTGLERKFCSNLISWTQDAQNTIMNTPQEQLCDVDEKLTRELSEEVYKRKAVLLHDLNDYFSKPSADTNLTVKYKAEFEISAAHLAKNTQKEMLDKCKETLSRRECFLALETLKREYTETISKNVKELLQTCKQKLARLNNKQLETTFEEMWCKTVSELPQKVIEKRNVKGEMEKKLRHNTLQHEALVNDKLRDSSIFSAETPAFQVKPGYVTEIPDPLTAKTSQLALIALSQDIIKACRYFIQSKTSSNSEYFPHVWDNLLDIPDSRLQKAPEESIQFSKHFVIDLKLHICAIAIGPFTKHHERFITENNPWNQLPSMKERYCRMFTEMYTSGDEKNTSVIMFSHQSLKPALLQLIDQRLGHSILEDISRSDTFLSRKHLQLSLLSDILEKNKFDVYHKFLNNYSQFTTEWIKEDVIYYCKAHTENIVSLLKCILDNITEKIKKALDSLSRQSIPKTVGDVFERLKQSLVKDIVLPMDGIGIVISSVLQDSQSIDEFCKAVIEDVDRVSKIIVTEFEKSMDVESWLDRLAVKPHEELFKLLVGCGKTCPLCKAPCDRGGGDHGEHATTLHYPQGLCGHTWSKPGKLSAEVCTASVSKRFFIFFKIHKFVNVDTESKNVLYADYRTVNPYYASWDIPEDPKLEPPLFWKFVFCNFNKEFAKRIGAKAADIPKEWKSITKQEVKDELRRHYGVPQTDA